MHKILSIKSVGCIFKILPTFLFLLAISFTATANSYKSPDFAFPKTVEAHSDSLLRVSLERHDDLMALRYAMNLAIARNQLTDSESIGGNINILDSIIPQLSAPYNKLALLLEAYILDQEYMFQKGKFDNRNLPLDSPFPADPSEWSGDMFKQRIYDLVVKATEGIASANSKDISEIAPLLTDYRETKKIGMTVNEFIAFKAEELLANISSGFSQSVIPFYLEETDNSIDGRCKRKIYSLLDDIINVTAAQNSVMRAIAILFKFYHLTDQDKEKYLTASLEKLKGTEGEGILLYQLWRIYGKGNNTTYYQDIKRWLDKYPKGYGSGRLQEVLSQITYQHIQVEFPQVSLTETAIPGKVTIQNLNKGFLLIYKLNSNQYDNYDGLIVKKFNPSAKPLHCIELKQTGTVPFSGTQTVEIPGLPAGVYAVIPSSTRQLPKDWDKISDDYNYSTVRVSDIAILASNNTASKDSGRVYVVKGKNQEPVEGATVTYTSNNGKQVGKGVTNKEGWVKIPSGYYQIDASYGPNSARNNAGFGYYKETPIDNPRASILTDLEIYRPGDTINYAIVGWRQENLSNRLITNRKIAVTLRDDYYSNVGSDTLLLNEEGRAWGKMVVPKGRLLGRYSLVAEYPEFKNQGSSSVSFYVEEYKLPAFWVVMSQEESSETSNLKFQGVAQTYAGMPESDANVVINVEYRPWRWWGYGGNASYSTTATTDAEGKFQLTLPTENLKGTVFERGRYTVTSEVTSPAGETEKSSPIYFNLGEGSEVRPKITDKTEVKGDSIRFDVPVYDMGGLPEQTEVEYTIREIDISAGDRDSVFLQGRFVSPTLELASQMLPSGRYLLEFKTKNEENPVSTETTIWRANDVKAPVQTPMWIPVTEYAYSENEKKIDVTFGSYWDDWTLCIISDGTKILSSRWLAPSETITHLPVDLPDSNSTLFVTLSGMHDLKPASGQIKIVPQKSLEKMEVTTVTFRDKISAGDKEEWKFRFKTGDLATPGVNAFAVMTDKALNSIYDFKWNFNFWKPSVYNKVNLIAQYYQMVSSNVGYTSYKPSASLYEGTPIPDWETYGYPLVSFGYGYDYYLSVPQRAMKKSMATTRNSSAEMAAGAVVTESLMMDAMAMKEEAADDAVSEEGAPQAGNDGGSGDTQDELRPVEMPVAFFKPDLKASDKGELELNFTVPDFNTTWQLQVAGYNAELLHAVTVLDAVASKSVMVKTNLPQYLRTGDKAEISATLYNNSDNPLALSGRMEVIDPNSGKVLMNKTFAAESVLPSGNRVVSVYFDVPSDVSALIVKSFADGANHTDGEQGVIPVLPSSTPVTEAQTFYAGSKQEVIELNLPKFRNDANVTLKYCDNPLWEVLLSLPALTEGCNSSALSISQWLFGTLTASDIIWNNAGVSSGLRKILDSQDSTLSMSNLSKDASLKISAIEATPWLNNADNETKRIRSLEKYFNRDNVEQQISLKTKALGNLQMADGGWSWFEGMKSSPYITAGVLGRLGYLNEKGLLSPELMQMAKKGAKYYDNWLIDRYEKDKKISVTTTVNYLYTIAMLDIPVSGKMKKIKEEALDSIRSQWRHWSVDRKAIGAMVLMPEAKYKAVADEIVESLKQFVDTRMSIEEEALLLELFGKTEGNAAVIEKVMQNMFLQKETQDWGSESHTSAVVHSLAGLSTERNKDRRLPEVFIGNKRIALPESQTLTGNFTVNLTAGDLNGKKLVIKRDGGIPAWGGVISQYVSPIQEVKKAEVENLAVEKRIFREDANGKLKEVSSFRKGDKVTVVLNLNVGKDMDYVVVDDNRSACLQPDDKTSHLVVKDGLVMYREIRATKTSFFIERLPAGKYVLSYDCHADRDGQYSLGIAETQCLYSPAQVAHSAGSLLKVE